MTSKSIGAILAGGRSRRFGAPKGLAILAGRPLIEWILDVHLEALPQVVVVVSEIPSPYDGLGIPVIRDERQDGGPLAGLSAALHYAAAQGAEGVCCTSCDTPFLKPAVLRSLLSERDGFDAVLAQGPQPGSYEPLFGWYSVRLLKDIDRSLAAGRLALHDLVAGITGRRIIPRPDLAGEIDSELLFHNINTPDDLAAAQRWFASPRPPHR